VCDGSGEGGGEDADVVEAEPVHFLGEVRMLKLYPYLWKWTCSI